MYSAQDCFRDAYLKTQGYGALLFLGQHSEGGRIDSGLTRAKVDKIADIERALTSGSRKTLKELSVWILCQRAACLRKSMAPACTYTFTRYRMAQAATLLRTTSKPIGEGVSEVDIRTPQNLPTRQRCCMSPADYRENAGSER